VKRGFKSEAEQIATETRAELGLDCTQRLDPVLLAEHLAVPIFTMAEAAKVAPRSIFALYFSQIDTDTFSAVTVFRGCRRLIVHNENHHPHRRASNLAHELSHILLEHEPSSVTNPSGERYWNSEMEEEATWLGGALLIPRNGALAMMRASRTIAFTASHYGTSEALCQWRIRQSGVDKQVARWQRVWRR
jgi:Zn-dependent peptidase ImmA (M78 family)